MFERFVKALKKANIVKQAGTAVEIIFMTDEEAKEFFDCLDRLQLE